MSKKENLELSGTLSNEKEERRSFVTTAAKFAGVLASLGMSGDVLASIVNEPLQPQIKTVRITPQQQAIGNLLMEAIDKNDVDTAIRKFGAEAKLDKTQLAVIKSLTSQELTLLARVKAKLGPLAAGGGDTVGYFNY